MKLVKWAGIIYLDMVYFYSNKTKNRPKLLYYYILFLIKFFLFRNFKIKSEYIFNHKVHFPDYSLFFLLFREIFFRGDYSIDLKEDSIIYDIGANIGITTLYYKFRFPKCKIICYEPDPVNFKYLLMNTSNFKNIACINCAVSDKNGKISFLSSKNGSVVSKINREKREMGEDVDCINFSDLLQKEIDLCKMDIEGEEFRVINELYKKNKIDLVKEWIIEYHHNPKKQSEISFFINFFETTGFKVQLRAMNLNLNTKNKLQGMLMHFYKG